MLLIGGVGGGSIFGEGEGSAGLFQRGKMTMVSR